MPRRTRPGRAGSAADPVRSQWWNFSSQHTGVVNFCFGDGSVHAISTSLDFGTWVYLCGYKDGQVVQLPW